MIAWAQCLSAYTLLGACDGQMQSRAARLPPGTKDEDVNTAERALFQAGEKRIAIISPACSTGVSLHSDRCTSSAPPCLPTVSLRQGPCMHAQDVL